MPPTTRHQSQRQLESSSSESDSEDSDFGYDDTTGLITFPSKLSYSLDELDEDMKDHVKHVIEALEASPPLVLQDCTDRHQQSIFRITELDELYIRIGTAGSDYYVPSCSCQEENGEQRKEKDKDEEKPPCRHILWLLDQITKHTLDGQDTPLKLTKHGYPAELGHPHDKISEFHLDMIADSLHCNISAPESPSSESEMPNPRRVQEVREILATLNATPVDEYRPDIFRKPAMGKKIIKKRDLECTIFRMLLRNNEFFHYFLSCMRHEETLNSPFRRLQQSAGAALQGLETQGGAQPQSPSGRRKNVEWCASHLLLVEQQINTTIQHTKRPLTDVELQSATRTLVYLLEQVVSWNEDIGPTALPKAQRNLCFRLIGEKDDNFVVGVLNKIPPSFISALVPNLVKVLEELTKLGVGAPPTYVDKLRRLIDRARGSRVSVSTSSKRHSGGQDSSAKRRMK